MNKKVIVGILAVILWNVTVKAQAIPVTLSLTIDELLTGRAVLAGDLDDTFFFEPPDTIQKDFLQLGTHWEVSATIIKITEQLNTGPFLDYNVIIKARHISNPPPHPGEVSPGLLLGGGFELIHRCLLASNPDFCAPGPQDASHQLIHPGSVSDLDIASSHVDDLNGALPGFGTADNQISVRIDLAHTPEPSTLALLGSSLVGFFGFRKKGRKIL